MRISHLLLVKVAIVVYLVGIAGRSRAIVASWRGDSEAVLRRTVILELAGGSVLRLLAALLAGNALGRQSACRPLSLP